MNDYIKRTDFSQTHQKPADCQITLKQTACVYEKFEDCFSPSDTEIIKSQDCKATTVHNHNKHYKMS